MNRLVLIDGNAILHRAYHALPPMTNPQGQPTQAVYGFISMLLSTITQLRPTHLIVAFDRAKPTFRKKLYKEYQSHRPKVEDEFISQSVLVQKVLNAMQVPIFGVDGYEADDVIGTLAKQATEILNFKSKIPKIDESIIVTGDRDLLQLVNNKVKLFMPIKGISEAKLFGEKEAEERMGVPPHQIADLKGLMGDASDNYPGVAGIGPKTAIMLLKEFGSVANVYKNLIKIKNPAVIEKLTKDKDNAFLSQKLATVITSVPLEFDVEKAKLPDLVNQEVLDVFGELGFKTLLKRLLKLSGKEEIIDETSGQEKKKIAKKPSDQLGLF